MAVHRLRWLFGWVSLALFATPACGTSAEAPSPSLPTLILAHEDGRVDGEIGFPDSGFESLVRFDLPVGRHRPRRLWYRVRAPGTVRIVLYGNSALDAPGAEIYSVERTLDASMVSAGNDGRWIIEDLSSVDAVQGVVWAGFRKVGPEPRLSASRQDAGMYFVRNHGAGRISGLMPVRRSPIVRLEVTP